MSVIEILGGVLLMLVSLVIIFLVLAQQPSGNGLSGAIGGGEMMASEARTRTTDAVLAKYTKIAAVVVIWIPFFFCNKQIACCLYCVF